MAPETSVLSIARKAKRVLLAVIALFIVCLLIVFGTLLAWSPGSPEPFVDDHGKVGPASISEKIIVDIGRVQQGMFIRGRDTANPVLLYLHGGMPEYFLTRTYPTDLERYFTVCWWEQRGSGLSFDPSAPPATVTTEQLVSDAIEVTNYLRRRFGKEKIYLMGHSGGTFLGVEAAARAPGLFYAYIGMAQLSNQRKSEQLSYDYMLAEFRRRGDAGMVRRLEAAPVADTGAIPLAYYRVRDDAMHQLGVGTTRDMRSVVTGIILASLRFPQYTLGEKINLWRGKFRSGVSSVWSEMTATNLTGRVSSLAIPVYLFHGKYDYTVSYPLARDFFQKLQAPSKGFYTFESSAHSPLFEEPERAIRILREDVLAGTTMQADPS